MPKKITTMQITTETLDRLREIGEMGNSYEDVIKRLLDEREKVMICRKSITTESIT